MKYWLVTVLYVGMLAGATNPVYAAWECQNVAGEYRCQESGVAGVIGDESELNDGYQMVQSNSVDNWDQFSPAEKRALLFKLAGVFAVIFE